MVKHKLNMALKHKIDIKQMLGMRIANIIKISEKEFNELIYEIESDEIFKELRENRIIRYKRFPKTDISSHFLEFKEEISRNSTYVDVQSLLEDKQEVVQVIRKLGIDNFKKYFLYNDSVLSIEEIAKECALGESEVKKIFELVDKISIYSEFYHPSTIVTNQQLYYSLVASIEPDDFNNGFVIGYFSPTLVKGKYEIDYDKLKELVLQVNSSKKKKIHKIIKQLEIINNRKTILYQLLEQLIKVQYEFFKSCDWSKIKPVSQKQLSGELRVHPSLVCRLIKNKSIKIPDGNEIALVDLFPSKKQINKKILSEILTHEKRRITDEELKMMLKRKHGIALSRRSIASYRIELGIRHRN